MIEGLLAGEATTRPDGVVFLSPHFDDAIGSCGGLIARLVEAGRAVTVLTVFGGGPSGPLTPVAAALHRRWNIGGPAERRAEDARACAMLGCRQHVLDLPDAIYRRDAGGEPDHADIATLFAPTIAVDPALVAAVADLCGTFADRDGPAVLVAPLGAGNHLDHRIVRRAGDRLAADGRTVAYYREFYYDDPPAEGASALARNPVEVGLGEAERQRKTEAFLAYRSQVPALFGGEAEARAYFAGRGRTEAYFTAGPGWTGTADQGASFAGRRAPGNGEGSDRSRTRRT